MHRNDRIPPQPDSPTYDPSASPSRSVRRNLFSGHLSRRPASSQQPQSPTNPHSPAHPPPPGPFTLSRPPLPTSRSTSQNSPFASPPHLPPTQTSRAKVASYSSSFMAETYDPAISPNRAISPGTAEVLFPSNSIVAVNPITRRPLLPTLPTLPRRLRLVDDDDDDEEDEDDAQGQAQEEGEGEYEDEEADTEPEDFSPHHHQQTPPQQQQRAHNARRTNHPPFPSSHPQPHSTSADPLVPEPPYLDQEASLQHDRDRLNTLLTSLMTRYRARRTSSHAHAHTHSQSLHSTGPSGTSLHAQIEKVGEQEHDEEREELLAHLLSRLRGEVLRAEEEGWMFGESWEGGASGGVEDEGGDRGGYTYGGGGGGGGVNSQGMGGMGGTARGGVGGGEEVVVNE